jgi:hypothetical protein
MPRYYGKNGKELSGLREARKEGGLPSVTTVINASAPHEYKFLEDTRLREALGNGYDYDTAMEVLGSNPVFEDGSTVHEALELYITEKIKSDPLGLPMSTMQLFNWVDKNRIHIVEKYYASQELKCGGRVDLIYEKDGDKYLADLKTVATLKKKPSNTWLLQMGGYYKLCKENGLKLEGATILQFSKKDQGLKELHINKEELVEAAYMFQLARGLFQYYNKI